MTQYLQIADQIAERIARGELKKGTRLPAQRNFAFNQGIAVSTASRVYEELSRRGLVNAEIGRGTFVSNHFAPLDPSLQEPSGLELDLDIVFLLRPSALEMITSSTSRFFKRGMEENDVAPASARAETKTLECFAKLTSEDGFCVDPANVLLSGNGKQAIAAAFSALAPRGGKIAVEALTYPFAISVARMLGIELVPLPVDDEGIEPSALDRAVQSGLEGVYLQPTLQSPLVITMGERRRRDIADLLVRHELTAIEDRVYGFLKPMPPIAAFAPEYVIQIDSLSKRLMPGLALGIISCPDRIIDSLSRSLRSGGWMAPSLSVSLAQHWISDGTVDWVEDTKRQDAEEMFRVSKQVFAALDYRSAPEALHGWLTLPGNWRSEAFVAACADLGIAVAAGGAFAVGKSVAPSGVRIAFSAPNPSTWTYGLRTIADLALSREHRKN